MTVVEETNEGRIRRIKIIKTPILRPKRSESVEAPLIVGPLGLWPWPILNVLVRFVYALRRAQTPATPTEYFPRTASRRVEYVRDQEGRIIERYEEITFD